MEQQSYDVLVVGGGIAGMAAAMAHAERGERVLLVEERPYLGGRARSFTDKTTGDEIDNGQHLMMGCYSEMLSMLSKLGVRHHLQMQRSLRVRFVDHHGNMCVLDSSGAPGKYGVALGILRLSWLTFASRLRALKFAVRVQLGAVQPNGRTCAKLLRDEGQSAEMITRFWEPIILATLNASVEHADAGLLVTVLKLAFFGSGKDDSKLIVPTVGLSALWETFPEWLRQHDGTAECSVSADTLTIGKDGVQVVLSNGDNVRCDHVVLALPQRACERLLQNSSIATAWPSAPSMSPIISLYLWYDREWLQEPLVAMIGTTVQWVFRKNVPGLVALTISAGSSIVSESTDAIAQACDAELRRSFPQMHICTLTHWVVVKEKQATPLFTPDASASRPDRNALSPLPITLAGDWINTGLPATLEGAVRSAAV